MKFSRFVQLVSSKQVAIYGKYWKYVEHCKSSNKIPLTWFRWLKEQYKEETK